MELMYDFGHPRGAGGVRLLGLPGHAGAPGGAEQKARPAHLPAGPPSPPAGPVPATADRQPGNGVVRRGLHEVPRKAGADGDQLGHAAQLRPARRGRRAIRQEPGGRARADRAGGRTHGALAAAVPY
eukprot:4387951-Pyramimonas_sp.AAC.1